MNHYEPDPVVEYFLHEHVWAYYPVFTTYPERHERKCNICGRREQRKGDVWASTLDGAIFVIKPATDWAEVSGRT